MMNINNLLSEYLDLEEYLIDKFETKEQVNMLRKYGVLFLETIYELKTILEEVEENFNMEFLCPYKTNGEDYIRLKKYFNYKLNTYLILQEKIIKLIKDEGVVNEFFYKDDLSELLHIINNIKGNIERNNKSDYVCPLINSSGDNNHINMMIAPNSNKGKNKLNEFIKNAKQLIIVDPFIYTEESDDFFVSTNKNLRDLEDVKIIYDKTKENYSDTKKKTFEKSIINSISNRCKVQSINSNMIHDRLWIKNKETGLALGTSLKSIKGKKVSFILELPREDVNDILKFLKNDCKIFV